MKKQDLVKLAILGMMGVGAALGAQQVPPQGNQDTTNYDGSKGICTDRTSAYSSSDTSATAGKPVPQGQKPAQSQQASSKAWGQSQEAGTCKGHNSGLTGCGGGGGSCTGLTGCGGSCKSSDACNSEADGTCANYSSTGKQNSAKMSNKRNLR